MKVAYCCTLNLRGYNLFVFIYRGELIIFSFIYRVEVIIITLSYIFMMIINSFFSLYNIHDWPLFISYIIGRWPLVHSLLVSLHYILSMKSKTLLHNVLDSLRSYLLFFSHSYIAENFYHYIIIYIHDDVQRMCVCMCFIH